MTVAALPPGDPLGTESWVLIAIAVAIVVLRCFARIHAMGVRHLELDDWAMMVAVVSNEIVDSPCLIGLTVADTVHFYRLVRHHGSGRYRRRS